LRIDVLMGSKTVRNGKFWDIHFLQLSEIIHYIHPENGKYVATLGHYLVEGNYIKFHVHSVYPLKMIKIIIC